MIRKRIVLITIIQFVIFSLPIIRNIMKFFDFRPNHQKSYRCTYETPRVLRGILLHLLISMMRWRCFGVIKVKETGVEYIRTHEYKLRLLTKMMIGH